MANSRENSGWRGAGDGTEQRSWVPTLLVMLAIVAMVGISILKYFKLA